MSRNGKERQVPRLALNQQEAAESLGMSPNFFAEHVAPDLKVIRLGRKRLYPVTELDRWTEQNAALTMEASR